MTRVAIIGSGPAGLFCADRLAGTCDVTIFEAGLPIEKRICPESGCKDCERCQILEGEGGAGGLSDGKNTYSITRGTQMESIFKDKDSEWLRYIDAQMVNFAGKGIWYNTLLTCPEEFKDSPLKFESYPLRHVGSDGIRKFVRGFIDHLEERDVELDHSEAYPMLNEKDNQATGVHLRRNKKIRWKLRDYDIVVIAAGLQGIPWIEDFMRRANSPLGSGPAGFGIRLEMDAEILADLHSKFYDYKIIYEHEETGLILRSFCCNQRGMVLNERHTDLDIINVNGHSFLNSSLRTKSSNMAIIAKIPETFTRSPQDFVRDVGRNINKVSGGTAYQPLSEFMGKGSFDWNNSRMTNMQSFYASLHLALPLSLVEAFRAYIRELNKIVPIIQPSSVVYAPEIKYYGRRVNVTNQWKSKDIDRLYVIGSGTGHMDSFVAAALSGIIAAENIKKEAGY